MGNTREEQVREAMSKMKAIAMATHIARLPELMQLELSMAQFRTMMILGKWNTMTIGHLAQELGVGQSTAGHLVDKLVRAGYAQRTEDAEDRRRTVVQLTSPGQDLHTRFTDNSEVLRECLLELSDEDLDALSQGLSALCNLTCKKQGLKAPPSQEDQS
jgi:MarR family transcriptional regulator, organic hydroperoxide resistance regulator